MDRAGTKRTLGVVLLGSGVLMLVLGGLIDIGIGLKFIQAAGT